MTKKKYRQRLDDLFSSITRLNTDSPSATPEMRQEIEALYARVRELEEQIQKTEKETLAKKKQAPEKGEKQKSQHAAPILYETERVGYLYAGNQVEHIEKPDMTLADEEGMISAALTESGQSIGKLLVKAPPQKANWTEEEVLLANNIAQQASLQIQNLRLLAATERARFEAESATRRYIHESWADFMDGIHQNERVGYAYDQTSVAPHEKKLDAREGYQQTVSVMDEQVGTLQLKPDPKRPLTDEDKALIASVADRIAQQVESIRLLAASSRFRAEAEEATNRLTHEGWHSYVDQQQNKLSFVYNSNQVVQMDSSALEQDVTYSQPINVRGAAIGELAIVGMEKLSPADVSFTAAVAAQVGSHIEQIRLSEQNEKRAADLATVATVSTTASNVLDPDELLQQVVDLTKDRFNLYHAHIYLADEAWHTLLLASGAGEIGRQMVAEGHAIQMDTENSLVARAARTRTATISNDVRSEAGFQPNPLLPETRSELAVPMIVGDAVLGVLDVQASQVGRFTDEDVSINTTLASQIAVALQNARLYVKQAATVAQLRELDRLKSSFLANMSHELRTPLNSILGFTDVILEGLDGPLTENMTSDLGLIYKNGQHLLHLINDVLDMAKIESGRMNLNIEKFNLQAIIEEVASITSPLASEKNLALFIEPDSDSEVEVNADKIRLRQVLINLINNAMKFTEHGSIAMRAVREGENVLISVKDTGLGIPPELLEAVFQEFTQVDTSTTRKVGGTGLGLPISRRLIEMHSGRLWAESTGVEGEGSTFYILLPIEAKIKEEEEEAPKAK